MIPDFLEIVRKKKEKEFLKIFQIKVRITRISGKAQYTTVEYTEI